MNCNCETCKYGDLSLEEEPCLNCHTGDNNCWESATDSLTSGEQQEIRQYVRDRLENNPIDTNKLPSWLGKLEILRSEMEKKEKTKMCQDKSCMTCKYGDVPFREEPCFSCNSDYNKWEEPEPDPLLCTCGNEKAETSVSLCRNPDGTVSALFLCLGCHKVMKITDTFENIFKKWQEK
jgi:hypothetical protein